MTLAIAFKGPEGLVLAVDSRVTLSGSIQEPGQQPRPINATYDNATKLLQFRGHNYVAAVTYGLGSLGSDQPRTAHSFVTEFENEIGNQRKTVEDFAKCLGEFYKKQYDANMPAGSTQKMNFYVAGFNDGEAYGRVYQIVVPLKPQPVELNPNHQFGISWGGQTQITSRLVNAFDLNALAHVQKKLTIDKAKLEAAAREAGALYGLKIPYQFLPLQDCVDLSILLVRTTAQLQRYVIDARGVGGAIDVVTITRNEGVCDVQTKQIRGESND